MTTDLFTGIIGNQSFKSQISFPHFIGLPFSSGVVLLQIVVKKSSFCSSLQIIKIQGGIFEMNLDLTKLILNGPQSLFALSDILDAALKTSICDTVSSQTTKTVLSFISLNEFLV
jgi:hypothetical protein